MVDPLTIAAGASAVSGVMGFKGNMSAAKAAKQTAEYNAVVAENEAVLLARKKRDEEESLRKQSDRLEGTQRVMVAGSGVQMTGSPLDVLAETYFSTNMDATMIQYAGDIEQVQKQSEAALTRAEGGARATALKTQAYTTLLGGAQKAATLMA